MSTVERLLGGEGAHFHSPVPAGSPLSSVVRRSVVRELSLACGPLLPGGHRARFSHRVVAGPLAGGLREDLRRFLGAGWITSTAEAANTLLTEVLGAASATALSQPQCGADGSVHVGVLVGEVPAILRVGRLGSPEDPAHAFRAMTELRGDLDHVPRPLSTGIVDDMRWTTELKLPGRRPGELTDTLLQEVAAFCARLPPAVVEYSCDPSAPVLLEAVPHHTDQLLEITHRLGSAARVLSPTSCHGDLWRGNCLVGPDGRLSGVVDWDAWRPAGLPGSDLLHLVATEARLRRRVSMGAVHASRPWEVEPFLGLVRRFWPEWADDPAVRATVGLDWWLHQVTSDLRRNPRLAHDLPWVEQNLTAVLKSLP